MIGKPASRFARDLDETGQPIPLLDGQALARMREVGRLTADILDAAVGMTEPGVTTADLDRFAHDAMIAAGARPATLGYRGYGFSSCISVNHVVTHGMPSPRKRLAPGDIVNIDISPVLDGWHGDASRTVALPPVRPRAAQLVAAAEAACRVGCMAAMPGAYLGDVAAAIGKVAAAARASVVADYCGHGIGRGFHQPPQVSHIGVAGTGPRLEVGMVFTVEPMLNAGGPGVRLLPDGWTVVTRDRSLSAQWEHTVAITEDGPEILTELHP